MSRSEREFHVARIVSQALSEIELMEKLTSEFHLRNYIVSFSWYKFGDTPELRNWCAKHNCPLLFSGTGVFVRVKIVVY